MLNYSVAELRIDFFLPKQVRILSKNYHKRIPDSNKTFFERILVLFRSKKICFGIFSKNYILI